MMIDRIRNSRIAARWRAVRDGGNVAHRVPALWLATPEVRAGDRLCVFVMLARGGRILPHSIHHARAWQAAGYKTMMVVIVDTIDRTMDITSLAFASGILLRENRGYDFGAWAAVIHRLAASISRCDVLAIANDSVIGPSSRFGEMLERVEASNAGVIGLVESDERRNHFQSFVLFFKRDVLKTRHFRKFWSKVRSGNRTYVIDHYELRLKQIFEAAGSRTETLFPLAGEPGANPTLTAWDRLLDAGFPYLKLELLRSNPRGVALQDWEQVAAANGLSPGLVQDHVLALQTVTPGPWAIDT